ncbi:MAG: hypothetical protein ABIW83_06530 [Allosphingosinicella sp.]
MASNELQISKLVKRLVEKTLGGQMRWEPSPQRNTYQVRSGDFLIRLTGPSRGVVSDDTVLTVMRLDGRVVEAVGSRLGNIAATLGGYHAVELSQATRAELERLYHMVADSNDEIDELLRAIG